MCKNEKPAPVVQCGVPGNLSGKGEEVVGTTERIGGLKLIASDRKGDGTDCHEVTSFLVVMTAFTMDMAVL